MVICIIECHEVNNQKLWINPLNLQQHIHCYLKHISNLPRVLRVLLGTHIPFGRHTRNHQIFCQSNQRAVWKVLFSKILDGIGRRLTGL